MSQDDEATRGSGAAGDAGSSGGRAGGGGRFHQRIADPAPAAPPPADPPPASPAGGDGDGRAARVAAPVTAGLVFVAAMAVAALASDGSGPDVTAGNGRSTTTSEAAAEVAAPAADTGSTDTGSTDTGSTDTDGAGTDGPGTTAAPATTAAATTTAPPATTATPPTTAAATAAPTTAPAGAGAAVAGSQVTPAGADTEQPVRFAVIRQGVVYLRGRIPSREAADEIIRKAEGVVGPGNVIDEYVIDPAAPLVASAPLYVEDLILFPTNSSEIAPDFVPLLQLGIALFQQNPEVTITVIGHTDAVGSPEYNMALSERRVASVISWFTDRGIDPARLVGEARGLTDPLVAAEPGEAEALNRRVEFVISGLLED